MVRGCRGEDQGEGERVPVPLDPSQDSRMRPEPRAAAQHPGVVWRYRRDAWLGKIFGMSDSNWSACTLAVYLAFGTHPVFTASSTQTNIGSLTSRSRVLIGSEMYMPSIGPQKLDARSWLRGGCGVGDRQLGLQTSVFGWTCRHGEVHPLPRSVVTICKLRGDSWDQDVGRLGPLARCGHGSQYDLEGHVETVGFLLRGKSRRSFKEAVE